MQPVVLKWVQTELSVALDLFTRCIVAVSLTPISTKAIDAAGLLYEAICPDSRARVGNGILPYTGVPTTVFCDPGKVTEMPGLPDVVPDTLVVDHSRICVSAHVRSVCARFGINIQPARPWRPTDKAPLERFYRTIDDDLLSRLPGYKGADIHGRGADAEDEAYYFFNELETIIREWVAARYHTRPHEGLIEPAVPGLEINPLEMLRMGIARTGRHNEPARPDLVYDFLATTWCKIHHYGVEVNGLIYDGPGLNPWRYRKKSPYHGEHEGDWPIRYNPDDISQVYFQEPNTHAWHVLRWIKAPDEPTPFSVDVWAYARRLARQTNRFQDAEFVLAELLKRWNAGLTGNRRERRNG